MSTKMVNQKEWWAPLWRGLVMDPEAKHYRLMGTALWLFLYLLLNADRRSGFLLRKIKTIHSDMGLKRDSILRWLNVLRRKDYIVTENTGRCLSIQIKRWKSISGVGNIPLQRYEISNRRGWKNPTSQECLKGSFLSHLSQKSVGDLDPNDRTIKKDILKNDIDIKNIFKSDKNTFKGFKPRTSKELLALDLAKSLDELHSLPLYLSYSSKYSETLLRKVLEEVKKLPSNKIKKSRGALFNYLIQKHAKNFHENISH